MVRYLYTSIRQLELVLSNPDHSITLVREVYSNLLRQRIYNFHQLLLVLVLVGHLQEPTGSVRHLKVQYSVLVILLLYLVLLRKSLLLRLQKGQYYSMFLVLLRLQELDSFLPPRIHSGLLDLYLISVLLLVVEISQVQYSTILVADTPILRRLRQTAI